MRNNHDDKHDDIIYVSQSKRKWTINTMIAIVMVINIIIIFMVLWIHEYQYQYHNHIHSQSPNFDLRLWKSSASRLACIFQNGSTFIKPTCSYSFLPFQNNNAIELNSLNSLILVHFSSFFGNLGSIGKLDTGNPSSNFHRPRHLRHLKGLDSPGRWCERLGLFAAAWLRREQKMSGRGRRSALGVGDRDFANKSAGI